MPSVAGVAVAAVLAIAGVASLRYVPDAGEPPPMIAWTITRIDGPTESGRPRVAVVVARTERRAREILAARYVDQSWIDPAAARACPTVGSGVDVPAVTYSP